MSAPSMVSRSGDSLVVRSVVSGAALYQDDEAMPGPPDDPPRPPSHPSSPSPSVVDGEPEDYGLPQCKIKRSYMCPRCTFYTQNPRVFLYHLKTVHNEKIKVYECPHCLYASKHSQKLQRHVTMVHAPGKAVSNPAKPPRSKAKSKTPRSRPLPMLLPARPPDEPDEDSEGRLVIDDSLAHEEDVAAPPECLEQVVVCTEEMVNLDATNQNNGVGFVCSVCSFTSRSESLMTRHERVVHLKKKVYRCSRCSYVTNLKSRFTKHVKYHTMPLIKCGQCDFKTAYKWNLDRHHRNHGGPGAFHCTACNFAADIKQSLTVHEMNHHVPVVGGAAMQNSGPRRRGNKVGGSDCGAATEEDAIDPDELELLRLEREDTSPQEGAVAAMTQSRAAATSTTTLPAPLPQKKKPLPSLIPLQSKGTAPAPAKTPPAKTPPLSERDLNEICAKSCPTSALKDFAPLIGDDDAFETKEELPKKGSPSPPPSPTRARPNEKASPKKKSGTFFDKLKEKLAMDGEAGLVCATCGLEARCLSELVLHQQQQHGQQGDATSTAAAKSLLSSSRCRCPHCRHRCKSSADLLHHLKSCSQAQSASLSPEQADDASPAANREAAPHPMENKVFVWNNVPSDQDSNQDREAESDEVPGEDDSTIVRLVGVETAPGYGSVTPSNDELQQSTPSAGPTSIKKVFKCPHCSFWASTASRFHVHIVGHLNRKPFECSLCSYRSNWRWDITKHIRLKSARDPSHERARLLMTDETGRRNYSKYNKHLTLMRVTEHKMDALLPGARQSKAVVNGLQGNVAPGSSEPIPILPAPPKLTRAPVPRSSGRAAPAQTTVPLLRPPPPLQAAAHVMLLNSGSNAKEAEQQEQPCSPPTLKRPANSQEQETEAKRANVDNKRTTWRCKQCNFRHSDRAVVLAHVKGHYRHGSSNIEASLDGCGCDSSPDSSACKCLQDNLLCDYWQETEPSNICQEASVWKHVLQRPNRPKPEAPANAGSSEGTPPESAEDLDSRHSRDKMQAPPVKEPDGSHCCEFCNFTSNSMATLTAHREFHKPHSDAVFKCYFCDYYVRYKEELLQHMSCHGISEDEEFVQKTVMINMENPMLSPSRGPVDVSGGTAILGVSSTTIQGATIVPGTSFISGTTIVPGTAVVQGATVVPGTTITLEATSNTLTKTSADSSEGEVLSPSKRYICSGCPYVSNSKSQFLYHKQFHRPRGALFKCTICSYNVSRRHLLHQHLKVHGVVVTPQKMLPENSASVEISSGSEAMELDPEETFPVIDTSDLVDIPVCWVLRNSKLLKMFKCRYCPHVNMRRTNIQEHERMHTDRPARPWESVQPHQRLTCELCSYTCNNAGVLSSHMKVHQVDYARLCALVDPSRKDDEQIRELSERLCLNSATVEATDVNESEADVSIESRNTTVGLPEGENKEGNGRSLLKMDRDVKEEVIVNGSSPTEVNSPPDTDRFVINRTVEEPKPEVEKVLQFCQVCPARFLYFRELGIHSRFHNLKLAHQCECCSYTARQESHLQAHFKVHTEEYQERTKVLLKNFPVHRDHPMPLHACLNDSFNKMWVVPSDEATDKATMSLATASGAPEPNEAARENVTPAKSEGPKPKHACTKCPATFFKSVALQYHLTLHGGSYPHKCRVCDYAVKTYGNLAKHEMIHGPREKLNKRYGPRLSPMTVPISGTELFQKRSEVSKKKLVEKNDQTDADSSVNDISHGEETDGVEQSLYQGCPDFVYPTYLKNGRLKQKRYKCHKCPSAFEKREQYRVHQSLHGSNQRYSCNKCDYSVKYYANYVQHLQKHSRSEEAKAAAAGDVGGSERVEEDEPLEDDLEDSRTPEKTPRQSPAPASASASASSSPQRSIKTINRGPLTLSVADRQTMMVMQQRRANRVQINRDIDKNYWCLHCPYNNPRRDGIDSHMKRHIAVSGVRNTFTCDYCDYTVPTQHFLREHTKVHFAVEKLPRPDTFMTCDKMELWVDEETQEKKLIFQDKGSDAQDDRFVPVLDVVGDDGETMKIFVNPSTGEILTQQSNGDARQDHGHGEWDSCSEGTNKSEVAVVERNGQVFAVNRSSVTSDGSDSASSSSSSTASSDIDDETSARSAAAVLAMDTTEDISVATSSTADEQSGRLVDVKEN